MMVRVTRTGSQGRTAPAWPARLAALCFLLTCAVEVARADRLQLKDGSVLEAEAVWEDADSVWYRRGGITRSIARSLVRAVERAPQAETAKTPVAGHVVAPTPDAETIWVHFRDGASVRVEMVTEAPEGVWYGRGKLNILVERDRLARIEYRRAGADQLRREAQRPGWTTGNIRLDTIIKESGTRHGVDPFLIFCVMEQESRFNPRAVSPKGARGLMQLMPGTARRFGVRRVHDPAENVAGGTRYLKELLGMFGGRVELALASYNAGEGAVLRYGRAVPPYRETRNYVKRIGARYGLGRNGRDGSE